MKLRTLFERNEMALSPEIKQMISDISMDLNNNYDKLVKEFLDNDGYLAWVKLKDGTVIDRALPLGPDGQNIKIQDSSNNKIHSVELSEILSVVPIKPGPSMGPYEFRNPYTNAIHKYKVVLAIHDPPKTGGASCDIKGNVITIYASRNLYINDYQRLLEHEFLHAIDPNLNDKFRSRNQDDLVPRKKRKRAIQPDDFHNYYSSGAEQRVYLSQLCQVIKEHFKIYNSSVADPWGWKKDRYGNDEKCAWILKEIENLIRHGECPTWIPNYYQQMIEIWKKQPNLWRTKIVPVLYKTLQECQSMLGKQQKGNQAQNEYDGVKID